MGEGFPLWFLAPMAWEGREPLRDWIYLSLSLSISALSYSALSQFLIYLEIRNSDWIETFDMTFFPKNSFLVAKEEQQPPYVVPMSDRGTPGTLLGHP